VFDFAREVLVLLNLDRAEFHGGRGRVLAKKIVIFEILARPYRAFAETTATVRANILKYRIDTAFAESAFKAADHGINGIGREFTVAVFTVGA
jgi:hypothetical protein